MANYLVNQEQLDVQHTQGKFNAMFAHPHPEGVLGCPLGRGASREEAVSDLLRRATGESGIDFVLAPSQGVDYFTAPMYEGDYVVLAQLLVRYHNSITQDNSSLYGAKMDKALCRDTFGTLYRRGPYEALKEIETHFIK